MDSILDKVRSTRARAAAVAATTVVMLLGALPASAQTDVSDVTDEITGAMGDLRSIVLGVIAGFFALVIVGVAIRVGSKYVRRGGSQA